MQRSSEEGTESSLDSCTVMSEAGRAGRDMRLERSSRAKPQGVL